MPPSNILIVEDDREIGRLIATYLRHCFNAILHMLAEPLFPRLI